MGAGNANECFHALFGLLDHMLLHVSAKNYLVGSDVCSCTLIVIGSVLNVCDAKLVDLARDQRAVWTWQETGNVEATHKRTIPTHKRTIPTQESG